ncbi:AIR synthase-related protein [Myxococcota bacterium]|nr:AIR synthase-related protein [Myxococcota bacterium]
MPSPAPVHRLEIGIRPGFRDPRGDDVRAEVEKFLHLSVARVRTRDVYHVEGDVSGDEAARVLAELTDPIVQTGALGRLDDGPFDFAITVGMKPGVTDPIGRSAKVAVEDTLGRKLGESGAVYTSTLYLVDGVDRAGAERIALGLLANPIIHAIDVKSFAEWQASPPSLAVPRVGAHGVPPVHTEDLSGSDEALVEMSKKRLLALTLAEMTTIRDHFRAEGENPARKALGLGAAPTDVELEMLAQTWSEHCKHKIFNATVTYEDERGEKQVVRSIFKEYIKGATKAVDAAVVADEGKSWLVSVFHDNAGVVAFDDRDHLVYKVETHNSPSALDPFGGAITGIVGVNRDPFGTGIGAELLSNVWGYCFASPHWDGPLPKGLLHPRRIRDGVHKGVIDGGNQSGVPYARGWELFDARFVGKPLVFCGTVGKLPVTVAGKPGHEKAALPGDLIVMAGGRIGADGIHGATFSSAALDESAPIQAVQIGDPITQRRMFDFLIEARDQGLYHAITDNGAGGLSSSVGEMATGPGGAELDLAKAPLKYAGLAPWEILLSEAQERMTLAVPPEKIDAFLALAARREVEATVLGHFTNSGYFHAKYGTETVCYVSMALLHEGAPDLDLTAKWQPRTFADAPARDRGSFSSQVVALVGRLNLASDEAKARHYDHEVKGLTVVKPWIGVKADVPAEATVAMVRHGDYRGYVLAEGVNPFYSDLDTHPMAQSVVDEAVRRVIAAGATLDRIALLDNFCWPDPVAAPGNPDGAYKMAQLVRACRGLYDAVLAYRAPLVSGKDSMKNDSTMGGVRISVPPTLLVSAIAQIPDVREAVTLDPKAPGERVFLLGKTRDELGGSEWLRWAGDYDGVKAELGQPAPYVGSKPPQLFVDETRPLYAALEGVIRRGLVRAAATPAKGGLAFTLAKMVMASELGMSLTLDASPELAALTPEVALFSESNGRFVVTVAEADAETFRAMMEGQPCFELGAVVAAPGLTIGHRGQTIVDVDVDTLKKSYKATLAR